MSNYATKNDLKGAIGIDTINLALKSNLAKLKADTDKIDIDELKTVPVDLSKLSNVVNYEVVKKTVYDKLAAKVNNIDTSGFVLKTKYDTDKSSLEKKFNDADKKIPNISVLVKKTLELEGRIPSITGLATISALTTVENKIPNVSNLAKKTDYDAKILDIENKHITTADNNKFTKDVVAYKIKK